MNTVQENHHLLENWRVGTGNGEICLVCLTENTLLDLAVTAIKYGGTAYVKHVGFLVFPRNAPQVILILKATS